MTTKQWSTLIGVMAVLVAGRLAIAGKGYLDDSDEFLILRMHVFFNDFVHLKTWTDCIFKVQAQLPELAIRLFEYTTILPLARLSGQNMLHTNTLAFMGLYNIAASVGILVVFFGILKRLQFSFSMAATGTLLLGTLVNFNLYTRHFLPYDHALLFHLLALLVLLKERSHTGSILLAGFLSALGVTAYMGSFMMVFINGSFLLWEHYKQPAETLRKGLLFALPFIMVVAFIEGLTLLDGRSYIEFVTRYYGTVYTEASLDEGFVYLFLYFYWVEKWWGLVLLAVFFAGSYLLLTRSQNVTVRRLLIISIAAYLIYAFMVYSLQQMPFHGRVLHMYYPFIIIGVTGWLQQQKVVPVVYAAAVLVVLACANYVWIIQDLNALSYPRSVVYQYGLFEQPGQVHFNYYEELPAGVSYRQRAESRVDSTGKTLLPPGRYTLVNEAILYHYPDSIFTLYHPYTPQAGDSVVVSALHFQSHPAYLFEYCTRQGRQFFMRQQLKVQIVKQAQPAG